MQSIVDDDGEFRLYQGVWRMQPLPGCAPPGKQAMRAVLRETVAEKLFFSGEACHPTQWATVHGGLNAGKTSAKHATWYLKSKG